MPVSDFVELSGAPLHAVGEPRADYDLVTLDDRLDLLARQLTESAARTPLDDQRLVSTGPRWRGEHCPRREDAKPKTGWNRIEANLKQLLADLAGEVARSRAAADRGPCELHASDAESW